MKKILAFALALALLAACAPTTAQPVAQPMATPQVKSKPFLLVFYNFYSEWKGFPGGSFPIAAFTTAYQNVLKFNNYRFEPVRGLSSACKPMAEYDSSAVNRRIKTVNAGKALIVEVVVASRVNPKVTVCASFMAPTDQRNAMTTSSVERSSDASAYSSFNDAVAALTTQAVTDVIAAEELR